LRPGGLPQGLANNPEDLRWTDITVCGFVGAVVEDGKSERWKPRKFWKIKCKWGRLRNFDYQIAAAGIQLSVVKARLDNSLIRRAPMGKVEILKFD
jgi:hypothetical protein